MPAWGFACTTCSQMMPASLHFSEVDQTTKECVVCAHIRLSSCHHDLHDAVLPRSRISRHVHVFSSSMLAILSYLLLSKPLYQEAGQ